MSGSRTTWVVVLWWSTGACAGAPGDGGNPFGSGSAASANGDASRGPHGGGTGDEATTGDDDTTGIDDATVFGRRGRELARHRGRLDDAGRDRALRFAPHIVRTGGG